MVIKKSLQDLYPEISIEWHFKKNGELSPQKVRPKSGKKVWWICNKGHEWQTKICTRTSQGTGCPYCSGKYATKENNLATTFPEISKEWHFRKNDNLTPEDVKPLSGRKVWWKCNKGHAWQAVISDRTRGSNCPYCSGRKATTDNNLAKFYPELANQWHPAKNENLSPHDVKAKSKKKAWWICSHGHEWDAVIKNRTNGAGCPYCSSQTSDFEIRVLCELKTIFSDVQWRTKIKGIECDIYMPSNKIAIEVDGFYWHKNKISNDKRKNVLLKSYGIELVRLREANLPLISDADIPYKNESALEIIKQLLVVLQKYSLDIERQKIVAYIQRDRYKNEKEYKKILSFLPSPPPDKSLISINPTLSKEWNFERNRPLTPEMFAPQSDKKVWWTCKKGHEWQSAIGNRHRGTGCPYCSGRDRTDSNNFAILCPHIVEQWNFAKNSHLHPNSISPKSGRKVWWKCADGHNWSATVVSRTQGSGCPYCSGRLASKEKNLAVIYPELVKQWNFEKNKTITPSDITPHARTKVWWLCHKGHEWQASVSSRTVNKTGCPYCTSKKACHDNNLAKNRPEIADGWNYQRNGDLTPDDVVE